MAVYDRRYRAYDGPLTPVASRWRVLPRHAWTGVFKSRIFVFFFALCFAWPIAAAIWIYMHYNLAVLANVGMDNLRLAAVEAPFFAAFMGVQCFAFGGMMTILIGPGLVSPDLANGALPLYLSRPLTRTGYTLGKVSVLAALISIITWIPGLLLFLLQSWLAGWEWFASHVWLGVAIVGGAIIWIVTISLLALATSALARRKVIAQTFLLGVIIFGAVAGQAVNQMFGTKAGFLFNLPVVMQCVWNALYRLDMPTAFPAPVAFAALLAICGLSVAILAKKLKAFEVVK